MGKRSSEGGQWEVFQCEEKRQTDIVVRGEWKAGREQQQSISPIFMHEGPQGKTMCFVAPSGIMLGILVAPSDRE